MVLLHRRGLSSEILPLALTTAAATASLFQSQAPRRDEEAAAAAAANGRKGGDDLLKQKVFFCTPSTPTREQSPLLPPRGTPCGPFKGKGWRRRKKRGGIEGGPSFFCGANGSFSPFLSFFSSLLLSLRPKSWPPDALFLSFSRLWSRRPFSSNSFDVKLLL